MHETIQLEKSISHYTITLHRPDKLNAFTAQMIRELHETLSDLQHEPWKIILLKGAGTSFSTGHDISTNTSFDTFTVAQQELSILQEITTMITTYPAPVLAAIHGYALGAGFEIALNCDLIYASDQAIFGFPELEVGLSITQGTSYFLPKLVGLQKAKELIFFSEKFSAQEALELNMINQLFPEKQLFTEVERIIASLHNKSFHALKEIKSLLNHGLHTPLEHCLQKEVNTLIKLLS